MVKKILSSNQWAEFVFVIYQRGSLVFATDSVYSGACEGCPQPPKYPGCNGCNHLYFAKGKLFWCKARGVRAGTVAWENEVFR